MEKRKGGREGVWGIFFIILINFIIDMWILVKLVSLSFWFFFGGGGDICICIIVFNVVKK